MANLSNSSLSAWLEFDGLNTPTIYPCYFVNDTGDAPVVTTVPCARVCNDSMSLFRPPTPDASADNLIGCGLWTTIMGAYAYLGPSNNWLYNATPEANHYLAPFTGVGLSGSDVQYLPSYADTISDCLELIYVNVKEWSYSDNGLAASACHRNNLFPLRGPLPDSNFSSFNPTIDSLHDCLEAICSPVTLNPDLAGIGVFSSFILQSAIAILAFVTLLNLELWPMLRGSPMKSSKQNDNENETHTDRIAIALVEFHKAQCYFSSVIQITALSLFLLSKKAIDGSSTTYRDFFDTSVLVILATAGLIPINLTLSCLTRYGRQSWYLLVLSFITSILATATLSSSYYITYQFAGYYDNNLDSSIDTENPYSGTYAGNCHLDGEWLSEMVVPLCGNSNLVDNYMPSSTVANWWTWLVWTNCVTWLFFCIGKKCYDTNGLGSYQKRLTSFLRRWWLTKYIVKRYDGSMTWIATAVVSWSLCFASQFWLFIAYFQHSVISYGWTFGQIIAITVWVPCIVEYLYIELNGIEKASNYKYPWPLKVVRIIKKSSGALIRFRSPSQRSEDASGVESGAVTGIVESP